MHSFEKKYYIFKEFFILTLLINISLFSFSQTPKNQHNYIDTINLKKIIDNTSNICRINPDSSVLILNKIISELKDCESELYCNALYAKGLSFYYGGKNDSAVYYFNLSKKLSIEKKYYKIEIKTTN